MAVCRRNTPNKEEATEILNNGYLKIFKNLQKFVDNKEQNFEGWIHRIMVNTAIDFYRSELKHQADDIDTKLNISSNYSDVLSEMYADEIMNMIQKLPTGYRTCFNLFALEGYTHHEIATELGISEGTSKSNVFKARAKLQDMIAKKNDKHKSIVDKLGMMVNYFITLTTLYYKLG
jgi:RNA polymerase sigma factor (sigma-70 family)